MGERTPAWRGVSVGALANMSLLRCACRAPESAPSRMWRVAVANESVRAHGRACAGVCECTSHAPCMMRTTIAAYVVLLSRIVCPGHVMCRVGKLVMCHPCHVPRGQAVPRVPSMSCAAWASCAACAIHVMCRVGKLADHSACGCCHMWCLGAGKHSSGGRAPQLVHAD